MIEKIGLKWCVIHAHEQKSESKTDKPKGTVIKCFNTKEKAEAMHTAIILSQQKNKNK